MFFLIVKWGKNLRKRDIYIYINNDYTNVTYKCYEVYKVSKHVNKKQTEKREKIERRKILSSKSVFQFVLPLILAPTPFSSI